MLSLVASYLLLCFFRPLMTKVSVKFLSRSPQEQLALMSSLEGLTEGSHELEHVLQHTGDVLLLFVHRKLDGHMLGLEERVDGCSLRMSSMSNRAKVV